MNTGLRSRVEFIIIALVLSCFSCAVTAFKYGHRQHRQLIQPKKSLKQLPSLTFRSTSSPLQSDSGSGNTDIDALAKLIRQTQSYEEEALSLIRSASDSQSLESYRILFLGKNGKITGMMKEMKLLAPTEKPKLGEVVNRIKTQIEEAIETSKSDLTKKEIWNKIQMESLGNTFQMSSIPGFYPGPGHRHPLSLVLDMTTEIFEEIGYELISGPESSPEIENDFFNFEALGMPPSVS